MSSSPLDLPTIFSQLPMLQPLANAEQMGREIQQSLFAPLVAQHQKLEQEKVQVVEKQEPADPVSRDRQGNQRRRAMRRKARPPPEPEQKPETSPANASPWAGNILDVKI